MIDLCLISYCCFVSYLSEANFGDGENGPNSVIGSVCFRVSGYCSIVVRCASPFTRLSRKSEWLICAKKFSQKDQKGEECELCVVFSLLWSRTVFGCENHLKRKLGKKIK